MKALVKFLTPILSWLIGRFFLLSFVVALVLGVYARLVAAGAPALGMSAFYIFAAYTCGLSLYALKRPKALIRPSLGFLVLLGMQFVIADIGAYKIQLHGLIKASLFYSSYFAFLYLYFYDFGLYLKAVAGRIYRHYYPPALGYFERKTYQNAKETGDHLEDYVCRLFKSLYGNATTTEELKTKGLVNNWAGDGGVDVVVELKGGRLAIQCKNYLEPVGNKVIGEILQGWGNYKATELAIVSPNGFTPQCTAYAKKSEAFHNIKIHLIDQLELNRLADQAERMKKQSPAA